MQCGKGTKNPERTVRDSVVIVTCCVSCDEILSVVCTYMLVHCLAFPSLLHRALDQRASCMKLNLTLLQ